MVRKVFAIIMLAGFVGIAGFGFLAMNHSEASGHDGCIAATASDMTCPGVLGVFESAIFHIDAFKSFSLAVVGSGVSILFALILAAVAYSSLLALQIIFDNRYLSYALSFDAPKLFEKSFTHWLALHENSPSLA